MFQGMANLDRRLSWTLVGSLVLPFAASSLAATRRPMALGASRGHFSKVLYTGRIALEWKKFDVEKIYRKLSSQTRIVKTAKQARHGSPLMISSVMCARLRRPLTPCLVLKCVREGVVRKRASDLQEDEFERSRRDFQHPHSLPWA